MTLGAFERSRCQSLEIDHSIPVPLGDTTANLISSHIFGHRHIVVDPPHHTTMSGRTFQLARNCPLRTTLVDEATGHAIYQIDTPKMVAGGVTRIRKFDSPQPHIHRDEDANSDHDHGFTDEENKHKSHKSEEDEEEGDETETGLPEASDEIARIYWKWFSSDKIVFRGKITTLSEFFPNTGKMGR